MTVPNIPTITSDAATAVADNVILSSEISTALSNALTQLQVSNVIDASIDIQKLLTSMSDSTDALTSSLLATIQDTKVHTPAGLLLSQQLNAGQITQSQFNTQVGKLILPQNELISIVSTAITQNVQEVSNAIVKTVRQTSLVESSPLTAAHTSAVQKIERTATAPIVPKAQDAISIALSGSSTSPILEQLKTNVNIKSSDFLQDLGKLIKQNLSASASSLVAFNTKTQTFRPQPKIMTGARAIIRLNGKVIALCNSLNYEYTTMWEELRGIDDLLPNELVPTSIGVRGSMSIFRTPNGSPISAFLQSDMLRPMIWPYMTIEIRDARTDELLLKIPRAVITSRSETYAPRVLVTSQLSFIGIGFRDEVVPEYPTEKSETDITGLGAKATKILDSFTSIL